MVRDDGSIMQPTVAGSKTSRFDKPLRSQIVTVSPQAQRRRGNQLPQPPFASVTMRWQAGAEQFTRRSATRSFNEVWQTQFIFTIPPNGGFNFWFVTMVQSCDEYRLVRKQVDLTSPCAVKSSRFPRRRNGAEGISCPAPPN